MNRNDALRQMAAGLPEDIARLDSDHEARARRDARSTERDSAKPGDFNNFAQRSYDYEALEDQLLKGSR